ncbi:MAG: ferrous iron transport protein A [Burkholderiales bacterium]|nr:ferrous iron transport protein A [Burkholderiales bacterium]
MSQERRHCHLSQLPVGVPATIAKFGDLPDKEIRSLTDLGLVRGATVQVLTVTEGGPLLVAIADARMAINRDVADQVKVFIN